MNAIIVGAICLVVGTALGFTIASLLNAAHEEKYMPSDAPTLGSTVEWRGNIYEVKQLCFDEGNQKTAKILGKDLFVEYVPLDELRIVM